MKKYELTKGALAKDSLPLVQDKPPVRAVVLGQGCIIAGTINGEIVQIGKSGSVTLLTQVGEEKALPRSHTLSFFLSSSSLSVFAHTVKHTNSSNTQTHPHTAGPR